MSLTERGQLVRDDSNFPAGYNYEHLASNASTLVKTGGGFLHTIVINKIGATGNTLTVYDGTDNTGAVIAVFDTTSTVRPSPYDCVFKTGLYVTLASGTAADVTITYV